MYGDEMYFDRCVLGETYSCLTCDLDGVLAGDECACSCFSRGAAVFDAGSFLTRLVGVRSDLTVVAFAGGKLTARFRFAGGDFCGAGP
jgi:hypothetical protein